MRTFLNNRNFWLAIILAGAVALLLFDRNNIFERRRLSKQIHDLENVRDYYRRRIVEDSLTIKRLETDASYLEQYARENYLLRKEGDKVIVLH